MNIEEGPSRSPGEFTTPQAEESPSPEYHIEIEQEQLGNFARGFGEKMFGPDNRDGDEKNAARQALDEALALSLVFSTAERLIRGRGESSLEQASDPMKRLQAIQEAQQRLSQAEADYSSWSNRAYSADDYTKRRIEQHEQEFRDIEFVRQLMGKRDEHSLESSLRSKMGWHNFEISALTDEWRAFLVDRLNEINLVNLAAFEDEQAESEGKRGRLFGTPRSEWLWKVLKTNGFQEMDGLMLPKDMGEEDKTQYLGAFESYRELFDQANTSERKRLNSELIQSTENLEGLIAKYEEVEGLTGKVGSSYAPGEYEVGLTNAQNSYKDTERSLSDARKEQEEAERQLRSANLFNRGGRERAWRKVVGEVQWLEGQLKEAAQRLTDAQNNVDRAKRAPQELKNIEQQFAYDPRVRSTHKDVAKRKLQELKDGPKY